MRSTLIATFENQSNRFHSFQHLEWLIVVKNDVSMTTGWQVPLTHTLVLTEGMRVNCQGWNLIRRFDHAM